MDGLGTLIGMVLALAYLGRLMLKHTGRQTAPTAAYRPAYVGRNNSTHGKPRAEAAITRSVELRWG